MRTFTNKPGTVYDANKTTVLFAEDLNEFKDKIGSKIDNITDQDVGGIKTFTGTEVEIKRSKDSQRRLVFSNSTDAHQMIVYQPAGTNELRIYNTNINSDVFIIDENGNVNPHLVKKGRATAGSYISLGGIDIGMASSGNRGFGIKTTGASFLIYGQTRAIDHNNNNIAYKIENLTVDGTFKRFNDNVNLGGAGNTQETIFVNNNSGLVYKVTCTVWSAYNDNYIIIERIY